MGIVTQTCVVVLCDRDGDDWFTDQAEYGVPHFDSLDEAREWLRNALSEDDPPWQIEDGKPVLCPWCLRKDECARVGHDWAEWWSTSHMDGEVKMRSCERCHSLESNASLLADEAAEKLLGGAS
jgi:hypothetical protein